MLPVIAGPGSRYYVSAGAAFIEPSNYPLELMSPREIGTSPIASGNVIPFGGNTNFPAGHRVNKAYPGIPLDIAAAALGGALPYTWALTNAPAGMSINSATGRITWANPTGGPHAITVSVTDAEDTVASSVWTLTVTTTGFYFIDNVNEGSGDTGTISAPYDSIAQVYAANLPNDSILYFRAGTYTAAGVDAADIASDGGASGANNTLEAGSNDRPQIWLAYPGETVVYDGLYGTTGEGNNGIGVQFGEYAYVDGIRFTNVRNKLLHIFGGNFQVFKDLTLDGIVDGSVSGSNPGGIVAAQDYGTYDYYGHFVGITATDMSTGGLGKFYSQRKWLVEWCETDGTTTIGMDPKAAIPRFEIRFNRFVGYNQTVQNDTAPIYGNYDMQSGSSPNHVAIDGEIRFNFIKALDAADAAVEFGNGLDTGYIYRNTFIGRPWSRWVTSGSSPTLHEWLRNVVINADSTLPGRVSITAPDTFSPTDSPLTTAPSNVTVTDHLAGGTGDGIVNTTTGELQGSYLTDFGPSTATPRGCIPTLLP